MFAENLHCCGIINRARSHSISVLHPRFYGQFWQLRMRMAVKKRKSMDRSSSIAHARGTDAVSPAHRASKIRHKLVLPVALFGAISFLILWLYYGAVEASLIIVNEKQFRNMDARFHTVDIVNDFPHDPRAFTQGLLYGGNDTLYESTGIYGENLEHQDPFVGEHMRGLHCNWQSSVREVHLQTGEVQKLHQMKAEYFGEGLTLLGERLFQVTWLTNLGFIYDRHNLNQVESFHHPMKDGWGLATDGANLFGSDGSSSLYYLDPNTFTEKSRVTVKYEGYEITYLNELEYINGEVWANVWMSDCIARISPKNGTVLGWILLHKLKKDLISAGYQDLDVLNGIAWDENAGRLFVTGKLWPKLFQIKLRPLTQRAINELPNINKLCLQKSTKRFSGV